MDIYVAGINNRNRSLNGDKVAVALNPVKSWRVGLMMGLLI